nr:unnamed protein product [Spirometra erinaceieuropaei]
MLTSPSFCELAQDTAFPEQHFPPSDAGESNLNAPMIAAQAPAELRSRLQADVAVTKAIYDADGLTHHRLVISKMRLRQQPRRIPQDKRPSGKLNTVLLNLHAHRPNFSNQRTQRLKGLQTPDDDATAETRWCQMWNAILCSAQHVFGRPSRQQQDWSDDGNATKAAFFTC